MKRCYRISPLDTLFFRDGRPFEQEDEGMADIRSLFPPWPSMLVGAFRAAMARAMGWPGDGDWPCALTAKLGDGPENTGQLAFGPPMLLRQMPQGLQALYPAPRHLLREAGTQAFHLLKPGAEKWCTDAGPMHLPESCSRLKDCAGLWLPAAELTKVLRGEPPQQTIRSDQLWAFEYRVGLQRDSKARTAVPGMLYAASQVRLWDEVAVKARASDQSGAIATALGLEVTVADDGLPEPERLGPLGGFRRVVAFERLKRPWQAAEEPDAPTDGRYLAVLLAPARLSDLSWNRPHGSVPGLPGSLIFACCERPVLVGGWDSRAQTRGPLPLRAHLPAGSVLFLQGEPDAVRALFGDRTRRQIGEATSMGFGHFIVGWWPQGGA